MSNANPTNLRLGMTGTLRGKRYRIVGRVVLGMDEDGETYYWNEFNLAAAGGESATLVFEETEDGPQWRLFTMFEPQFPITAEDAATKQVGDPVNLEGTDARVTLVDESRVYYIEGQAPEGVEVGDVAHYFNAEAPGRMIVVSWTGDEVECYEGENLTSGTVKSAFNLAGSPAANRSNLGSGLSTASSTRWLRIAGGLVAVVIVLVVLLSFRRPSGAASTLVLKAPAPEPAIADGVSGRLKGQDYRVLDHSVVEVARVGLRYGRHEYRLEGAETRARLIFGLNPNRSEWFLFKPVEPVKPLTPEKAALVSAGQVFTLSRYAWTVDQLFQTTVLQADRAEAADAVPGSRWFGFRGKAGAVELMVE